ncbi:MAG: proton-conducting transporter membrane subunit [Rickettsiaceae bacterium]
MLFHPVLSMLFFVSIMLFIKKQSNLFKFVALASPVVSSILLILAQGDYSYELYNLKLTWTFNDYSKLIGLAFLIILLVSNSYALSQKKYYELILGCAYGGSIFISLLAKDFISMFIGLEIMMLMSSIIIFIGDTPKSINAAKQYFLTHLVSSSMILIGIVHIISKSNSIEMTVVTDLFNNPEYSNTLLYIMFIGMIINIAAFPFSGWMVNYYKEASASGSLYLINFTTKLSIILLMKIFVGFEILKYVALIMILYAGFKVVIEDNIFALLCYLSIISMGIMILAIASGDKSALSAVFYYLFIHIIYKSLLSIISATLRDKLKITLCSELARFKNKVLLISSAIGISLMINIPFSLSFYSKIELAQPFSNSFLYIIILFASISTMVAIPWKECIKTSKLIKLQINFYNKLSLVLISITAILIGFIWFLIPFSSNFLPIDKANSYFYEITKQFGIFGISAIIILNLKLKRKEGTAFNILEKLGDFFSCLYRYWEKDNKEQLVQEKWRLDALEEQIINKLSIFHNQQTAIFVVISLLIIMISTLIFNSY